ncbi:MAG TPA: hypothetical protein VLH40_04215 [Atribacteraceae bacterium]|nr:hypothetical protein [Atribacteraceae bacterium]
MTRVYQILFLMFVLCMSLAYLAVQAQLVNRSFLLDMKRGRVESLLAERNRLEVAIAQAASLDRIGEIATNRLGMVQPTETIYLASGSTLQAERQEPEQHIAANIADRVLQQ